MHECSICHKSFSIGQALREHKCCHYDDSDSGNGNNSSGATITTTTTVITSLEGNTTVAHSHRRFDLYLLAPLTNFSLAVGSGVIAVKNMKNGEQEEKIPLPVAANNCRLFIDEDNDDDCLPSSDNARISFSFKV